MVQFGIWTFDEKFGLVGRPGNFPELYLNTDKLWDVRETSQGPVWKWPVEFASIGWFTPQVADDFNRTFFYAQGFFEAFRPQDSLDKLDIDKRTIQIQSETLVDSFPGADEELNLRNRN